MLLKTGSLETDMGRAARIVDKNAKQIQRSISNAVSASVRELAAVAGIGYSIAQAWNGFNGAIDAADKVDELSARLGISTETLSGYRYAAQLTGTSLDSLGGAIGKLSKSMAAALDPTSKQAKLFKTLGVDVTDALGQLRRAEDVLPELMTRFKTLNNETLETAVAMEIFGKSGGELLEFLNLGSDGLDRMSDKARTLGGIIDGETAAAAAKFRDETDNMTLAMEGLYLGLAEQLLPTMTQATQSFTAFVSDGEKVAEVGQQIDNVMDVLGGTLDFVGGYFKAIDDVIVGTTWGFQGLAEAAQGVIDLDWDRIKRGMDLANEGSNLAYYGEAGAIERGLLDAPKNPGNGRQSRGGRRGQRVEVRDVSQADVDRYTRELQGLLGDNDGRADKARKDAAARAKEAEREAKQRADALEKHAAQARQAAADLEGPYASAVEKARQQDAAWRKELEAGNMTQADYAALVKQQTAQLAARRVELEKQQKAPQALLDTMTGELRLLGMIGPARERYQRQLQNENDMRRAITEAIEGGNTALRDSPDMQAKLIAEARAFADWSMQVEEAAARAEEWAGIVVGGVADASSAFADFVANGADDFGDFWDDLKDIAKRGVADLIRQFLNQKIVIPIQTQILNGMNGQSSGGGFWSSLMGMFNGGGQGGGGFWSSLAGLFKGNGFAGAGQNAGNWASMIGGNGGGGFLSAIGSLFGGGTSAATGAVSSGGTTWGGLVGMANASTGTSAVSGATGAASGMAGAMGSVASFMPWVALIMAGMKMADKAYGEGFGLQHQNRGELLMRGNLATGGLATPLMLDSMSLDVIGRALGMDRRTAAIFSGSSLLGKAFGRSAPKATGSGITGSYGFDGFSGQSYVDWKQKGGWFRSDKRGTQYSALDSDLDQVLDRAGTTLRKGAERLAKQLGIDISKQLSAVRVNIGKLQLDADPDKAQQQIEALIATMIGQLSTESVKILGFGNLLNKGFEAGDVMSALAASISLVTGSAEGLGRALEKWELGNITKGVEFFMKLAQENGTTLEEEISRVTGVLGNYGALMADVQGELLTAGLNDYQRAALGIETTYRQQVNAANEYARALGLSGARAEDLAKIEELRAHNMAALQQAIEKERDGILGGLALSQYSPLTDQEKLTEAMKQLQDAVSAGDLSGASALSQTVLGLGRNLYASGNDYNALYKQVTGMIGGMGLPDLDMDDGTTMGDLAGILIDLPQNIARQLFALASGAEIPLPAGGTAGRPTGGNSQPVPVVGAAGGDGGGGGVGIGGGRDETTTLLQELVDLARRQQSVSDMIMLRSGQAVL
ncbi:hypothetical protein [Pseudoxanthomonas sp. LjRoot143]|uniref:hypothetical protein n=1 Tax=Pseudoxanthomonas sp. LjRoot143 TaxID=3342266 RepID=UPI003F4FE1A9